MDDRDHRLGRLLDEFGALLRHAIAKVGPADLGVDPEDVEQEVRLRLWRLLEGEREIRHPQSYLYRMAFNAALDAVKSARRRREDAIDAVEPSADEVAAGTATVRRPPSPEAAARRRELLDHVEAALARISENRRTAVRFHLQGFTTTETGATLGWTEAKARNLTYRGLADLRRLLRERGIEYEDDD